jgi:predicted nucleic acid-binding protein
MPTFLDNTAEPELDKAELRSRREQDIAFVDAMHRAVARRLEHPPMVGVDTRPGTRNPITMVR